MAVTEETKEKLVETVENDKDKKTDEKPTEQVKVLTQKDIDDAKKQAIDDFKKQQADEKKKADEKAKLDKAAADGDKDTIIADLQSKITTLETVQDKLTLAEDLLQKFFDAQTKDLSKVLLSAVKNLPIEQKFEWLLENQAELQPKTDSKDDKKETVKIPTLPNRETKTTTKDTTKADEAKRKQHSFIRSNF